MGKVFRVIGFFILCILGCVLLGGCFSTTPPSNPPQEPVKPNEPKEPIDPVIPGTDEPDKSQKVFYNIPYGEHERHMLDIFLPNRLGGMRNKAPFFMLIHGGSWVGGDKSDFYYLAKNVADYGYAAVLINYRLLSPESGVTYLDMLDDITLALNLVNQLSDEYMLSTNKAALFGNSAGGHLALLYSYKVNRDSPIPIAFVASQVGSTDFTDPDYYLDEQTEAKLELLSALIGERVSVEQVASGDFPKTMLDASPITHVSEGFPPTLLAYGMKDDLVPYTNGVRLLDKLRIANPNEHFSQLVLYKNSGHELEGDEKALEESLSLLYQFSIRYLPLPRS